MNVSRGAKLSRCLPPSLLLTRWCPGLCVAGASDWLDGYIARNSNQQSVLGSILDPLADKILVAAVAVPLAVQGIIPGWLVCLMLTRDLGLVAGSLIMRSGLEPPEAYRAVKVGVKKAKTVRDLKDLKGNLKAPPINPAAPFESFEVRPTMLSKVRRCRKPLSEVPRNNY